MTFQARVLGLFPVVGMPDERKPQVGWFVGLPILILWLTLEGEQKNIAVQWGISNHNKQKCKMCPTNNHGFGDARLKETASWMVCRASKSHLLVDIGRGANIQFLAVQ